MTSSQTFSILFWINSSRAKDNMAEIYVRIVVNRKRTNISLKTKIDIEKWDKRKGRLKTKDKSSLQVNSFIEQTRTQIFQCYMDLKAKGEAISAQSIKASFLGEDEKHASMMDLIAYHNEKMEHVLHYDTMIGFLLTYLRPHYKYINQVLLGLFVVTVIQLLLPFLTQSIVDFGINFENVGFIYLIVVAQLFLFLTRSASEVIRDRILLYVSTLR